MKFWSSRTSSMTHERAQTQDIRPLKIAILNLMPTKIETETQLLRLLSNSPLQVDVELLHTATHVSKNTSSYHLNTFYKTFGDVKGQRFDGLIYRPPVNSCLLRRWITGMRCARSSGGARRMFTRCCTSAGRPGRAVYHYGIPHYPLPEKLSGIYNHTVLKSLPSPMRGFDDNYFAPHLPHRSAAGGYQEAPGFDSLAVSDLAGCTSSPIRAGGRFLSPGTRSTTGTPWPRSISGT